MRTFLILFLFLAACGSPKPENNLSEGFVSIDYSWEKYPVSTSIRALEIAPDGTVWYAGANGRVGYSSDNGKTWIHDSLSHEGEFPEFRSISVTNNAVMILSVGSPALLFRSTDKGETWDLVYTEKHEDAFYDAMTFWDDQDGIAMGDPTENCLSVIITRDGGLSWAKIPCESLPDSAEGEAAFAASNTNIAVQGENAWIATGGEKARVLHTGDKGKTWEVYPTPMNQGGTMTGIFTMDFYDELNGIIFGGDWEDKDNATGNKAFTNDGGQSWELLTDGKGPGYRSCVQYVPGSEGNEIFAVGIPGVSYSADGGKNWQLISDSDFYTIRISGNTAWLAGNKKIAKLEFKRTNQNRLN